MKHAARNTKDPRQKRFRGSGVHKAATQYFKFTPTPRLYSSYIHLPLLSLDGRMVRTAIAATAKGWMRIFTRKLRALWGLSELIVLCSDTRKRRLLFRVAGVHSNSPGVLLANLV